MGKPKRQVLAAYEGSAAPPDALAPGQIIARIVKGEGNNLFTVKEPKGKTLLVELPSQFRSTFFLKRGGFVLVDTEAFAERENKLGGEIVNVVREEKGWRKMGWWPAEFKLRDYDDDSEEDESTVGKMPPSDSDED